MVAINTYDIDPRSEYKRLDNWAMYEGGEEEAYQGLEIWPYIDQ